MKLQDGIQGLMKKLETLQELLTDPLVVEFAKRFELLPSSEPIVPKQTDPTPAPPDPTPAPLPVQTTINGGQRYYKGAQADVLRALWTGAASADAVVTTLGQRYGERQLRDAISNLIRDGYIGKTRDNPPLLALTTTGRPRAQHFVLHPKHVQLHNGNNHWKAGQK